MHYYKFNIGDYASHTQHLDPLEDIAYRRMLDWVYLHESPLPNSPEQIGRLIRMRTHCECIANVLKEFFDLTDYGWIQEKAFNEIDSYKDKSTKAKASAAARWSKKPIESDANALRPECERNANHKPLTINQEPLTKEIVKQIIDLDFAAMQMSLDQINELIRIRKANKGGKLTQRVINGLAKEFAKGRLMGLSTEDILTEWETRAWKSLKSDWLKPSGFGQTDKPSAAIQTIGAMSFTQEPKNHLLGDHNG
jgi:uncharacterized protein YdaU (DUF1376 family)